MTVERLILAGAWAASALAWIVFVPRAKRYEAVLVFLFVQALTWLFSLLFVEAGLVRNPVREFPRATGGNFTFNYVLYPTLAVLFCLWYPQRSGWFKKLWYNLAFIAAIQGFLFVVRTQSHLLEFGPKTALFSALFFLLGQNAAFKYAKWFFRKERRGGGWM